MINTHNLLTGLRSLTITAMSTALFTNPTIAEIQHPAELTGFDYGAAISQLEKEIADELQRGILTGVSVAVIDGQRIVLSAGYGYADKQQQVPATDDTVYRVGSISKVFTALAAMQLVEQDKLDLDVPLQQALPGFRIVVPFENASPVTLRQFMCHRSGLVRESPVGSYFDDSEPSIEESIASLESCVLVNPPNTKTRYSNIGATVVGQAVAKTSECSYEQCLREKLLDPIGMNHSSFRVDDRIRDKLATGYMRVADGKGGFFECVAPKFELGTIPAGNLYSTVNDMAHFAKMLLAGGTVPKARIVQSETLAQMSIPQLTENDTGFGLGFFAGKHGRYRTIQHTGAVYGFSASLVVLPKPRIAVVVFTNSDLVAGRVKRISETALDLMLAAKIGEPVRDIPATIDMEIEQLAAFIGQFESPVHWAELKMKGDQLVANIGGQPMSVRPIGPLKFEIDGRIMNRGTLEFKRDESNKVIGFRALDQDFTKVPSIPTSIPKKWNNYLGSYGPEFIPLVISAHHGHLYAMTENEVDYRLTPVTATVFKMPEGLYADEYLVFEQDTESLVHAATLANMKLERRSQQ